MAEREDTGVSSSMEEERWACLRGLRGYEISTHGRVFSEHLQRNLRVKPDRKGYVSCVLIVGTGRDRHKETWKVHRLVALAFLGPPPTPEHTVDHFPDRRRDLNHASNLRWATLPEQRANRTPTKVDHREVEQIDLQTGEVKHRYDSATAAAAAVGGHQGQVTGCCRGKRTKHAGFGWRYAIPRDDIMPTTAELRPVPTWLMGGFDMHYWSVTEDGRICNQHMRVLHGTIDETQSKTYQFKTPNGELVCRRGAHLVLASWRPTEFTPEIYEAIQRREVAVHHEDGDNKNDNIENLTIITTTKRVQMWHDAKKQKIK